MDPITAFVFSGVLSAVFLYALYWVIRKAVAAGIGDARRRNGAEREPQPSTYSQSAPE